MSWLCRKIILLSLFAIVLTSCGSVFGGSAEDEAATPTPIPTPIVPDKPTYTVQKGPVINELEFTGRISPVEEESLYFKTGGYVKRTLVERDDEVKAGDLLAELEIDDLLKQMAQAEVNLNSAQLRLNEAEKSLERQIAQADLDLAAAQARLDGAKKANADALADAEVALQIAQEQLARLQLRSTDYATEILSARIGLTGAQEVLADTRYEYQKALDRPWEPESVREGLADAVTSAERNLEISQARYEQALVSQEVYQHDLLIQQLAVAQAEAHLEQLREGVDPLLEIELQRAQQQRDWLAEGVDPVLVNDVNQAQLALERLEAQVADAQIIAPMDGTVLSMSIYAGRPVDAFQPAVIVADPANLEVSADLTNTQLGDLIEGMEAGVSLSSFPGETWQGTIRRLPYPYGSGGGTERLAGVVDESVRVSLVGDYSELELGDLARVKVILEEIDDALWLPPAAIRTFQGRNFVIVQDEDRQRRADVTIGIEGKDRTEILEGLAEGQIIVGQ
jgi:multidrug efflux pump subunit AcrA (membrane-fusion protein)